MFTGFVDHCGVIKAVQKNEDTYQLHIETQFDDLLPGESIAVDGTCLTVTTFDGNVFGCEVSPETKKVTIVDDYHSGRLVNLERALRLTDRLGGHFVLGHVDDTGQVLEMHQREDFLEVLIKIPKRMLTRYHSVLVKKGSIAINGVSLTINEVWDEGVKLMLIPHTLMKTNLSHLSVGDRVNVEFDWLAKMAAQQIEAMYKKMPIIPE